MPTATTALERALIEQHGLEFVRAENIDGVLTETWRVSSRALLIVTSIDARFVVDGEDRIAVRTSLGLVLAALPGLRTVSPEIYGSNRQ